MYMAPAIQRPTIEQLRSAAEALHLHIPADQLDEYKGNYHIHAILLASGFDFSIEAYGRSLRLEKNTRGTKIMQIFMKVRGRISEERLSYLSIHRVRKKRVWSISGITSSNPDRFSKFFHNHNLLEICNKAIIKYPTTP